MELGHPGESTGDGKVHLLLQERGANGVLSRFYPLQEQDRMGPAPKSRIESSRQPEILQPGPHLYHQQKAWLSNHWLLPEADTHSLLCWTDYQSSWDPITDPFLYNSSKRFCSISAA